jgi:hypothetical protein
MESEYHEPAQPVSRHAWQPRHAASSAEIEVQVGMIPGWSVVYASTFAFTVVLCPGFVTGGNIFP